MRVGVCEREREKGRERERMEAMILVLKACVSVCVRGRERGRGRGRENGGDDLGLQGIRVGVCVREGAREREREGMRAVILVVRAYLSGCV